MTTREEIRRRRTFAIISHPDAGKTTLTEKLLLYGGAIQLAGSVKGQKNTRHAVSDWMEIEKQRGISVTSSVLQFEYAGFCVNILDTPGHQDFSEDTYRTLMAADAAVMVIDAAKGVEAQTKKLFKVCVMRGIPIFTFVNKMDREAKPPLDLLTDIEEVLGIDTYAMNWPIGSGKDFQGVYDRERQEILTFEAVLRGSKKVESFKAKLGGEGIDEQIGADAHMILLEDIELLDGAGSAYDEEAVLAGRLTPVFFGSGLTNFGVEPFLKAFLQLTPPPLSRTTNIGELNACAEDFSAFVFKIQANMNRTHRDRIAFMRICSGRFEKGMEVRHEQAGKTIRISQAQQMMAEEREMVEEAYSGDILGVFDPGIFSIGDTLNASKERFRFAPIPVFAPEHFATVRQKDTMKRKQFVKGIEQIAQEGAIQIFRQVGGGMEEIIVGAVGVLQFEVLEYRLKNEYNVDILLERLPYSHIRWIEKSEVPLTQLDISSDSKPAEDMRGRGLLLFTSYWNIGWAEEHNKGLVLSEFGKNHFEMA